MANSTLSTNRNCYYAQPDLTGYSPRYLVLSRPLRSVAVIISILVRLSLPAHAQVSSCMPFDGCSGPNCPGTYPGTLVTPQMPAMGYSGTDASFNMFVNGNFTVPENGGSQTEGRILVGGNFIFDGGYYGVGTTGGGSLVIAPDGQASLVVRGDIVQTAASIAILGNSQPGPPPVVGNVLVGGSVPGTILAAGGPATIQDNQGTGGIDAQLNASSVQANLVSKSNCYGLLTPTGTFNAVTHTLQGNNTSALQVFTLTPANLTTLINQNLLFSNIPANATIIINVTGTTVNWQVANIAASIAGDPNYSALGTTDPDVDVRKVIFNLTQATSVTLNGTLNGSVLVPNGDVILNATLNGRLAVGGNLNHNGASSEIHNYPFNGDCSCASTQPTGTIGSVVTVDLNKNGQRDATEPGVDGITVRLLRETAPNTYTVVSTTLTTGGGYYLFTNLVAGTYIVEFDKTTLPTNYTFTASNALGVPVGLNSDANVTTGRSGSVAIVPTNPSQQNVLTIDAGIINMSCQSGNCVRLLVSRAR